MYDARASRMLFREVDQHPEKWGNRCFYAYVWSINNHEELRLENRRARSNTINSLIHVSPVRLVCLDLSPCSEASASCCGSSDLLQKRGQEKVRCDLPRFLWLVQGSRVRGSECDLPASAAGGSRSWKLIGVPRSGLVLRSARPRNVEPGYVDVKTSEYIYQQNFTACKIVKINVHLLN